MIHCANFSYPFHFPFFKNESFSRARLSLFLKGQINTSGQLTIDNKNNNT